MEYIVLWARYGTPILLLALLVSNIVNSIFVKILYSSVKDVKEHMIWDDTYKSNQRNLADRQEEIDRRIKKLESKINGV